MKILLLVIDGMGDEPIPQLGGKTPLEAAKTPNLDWLAKNGTCGLVKPFQIGEDTPTSEDTHLALFGYDPRIYNPGRGVLEALGISMKIMPGDVCLRGNFATINDNLKIIDRRAGRIEKTESLIEAISGIVFGKVKFLIGKATSHRLCIIIRGRNLSAKISRGDPKKTGVPPLKIEPLEKSRHAVFTARILNQFLEKTHLILKDHPLNKERKLPANYILVRGAGKLKKIKSFPEKYKLKSAFIAGGAIYKGIGRFLGMEEIEVKGATGLPNTNLRGKIEAAKNNLKKYDFIFCHIKPTDIFAEDGNFKGKKEYIEKIDENLKPLLELKNVLLIVTADHSSCCLLKGHCAVPVPLVIYGCSCRDFGKEFSEKACRQGRLGVLDQLSVLSKIFSHCRK